MVTNPYKYIGDLKEKIKRLETENGKLIDTIGEKDIMLDEAYMTIEYLENEIMNLQNIIYELENLGIREFGVI